jgi:hypothetical protein
MRMALIDATKMLCRGFGSVCGAIRASLMPNYQPYKENSRERCNECPVTSLLILCAASNESSKVGANRNRNRLGASHLSADDDALAAG